VTAPTYSLAAWRKHREAQEQHGHGLPNSLALADIPPDAPMDGGIVLGCWNGERFVAWQEWIVTAPILLAESKPALPEDARLATAICGQTRIWIARDGDRWLMFAGTQMNRRMDFASPFLDHAIRTAEAWYGPASGGWQVECKK